MKSLQEIFLIKSIETNLLRRKENEKSYLIFFIFFSAICSGFLILNQIGALTNDNQNYPVNSYPSEDTGQAYNVKVAEFKFTSTWGTPGGVMAAISFNITLENLEQEDLDSLSLDVKMLDANGSKIKPEALFYGPEIIGHGALFGTPFDGILHAKEVRTIRGGIISDWGTVNDSSKPLTAVATVKIGNQTLDELRYNP